VPSPELTASAPRGSRDATRPIDISYEHSRAVNGSTVTQFYYQRSYSGRYAWAIYAGNRVQVTSTHAVQVLRGVERPARQRPDSSYPGRSS
jgi:hypothetical protein